MTFRQGKSKVDNNTHETVDIARKESFNGQKIDTPSVVSGGKESFKNLAHQKTAKARYTTKRISSVEQNKLDAY